MSAPVLILGPQRPTPNLRAHLDRCVEPGLVALITAGWRHDEDEVGPLHKHIGRPLEHLRLYAIMDQVLREAPDLARAYHARQARILAYKEVYRISLRAAFNAVRELRRQAPIDPELFQPDLEDAFEALRQIDTRLLRRVQEIHEAHAEVAAPYLDHPAVQRARARILAELEPARALLLAGGHVGVLRNRLRFFGLEEAICALPSQGVPVFCWSAGAMVLTERVVLFYDDPPHGHGEAEVLGEGFGLLPGMVLLPHARLRLDLADEERVALFAGRFSPRICVGLEPGAALELDPATGTIVDHSLPRSVFCLQPDGSLADGGPP
ncbi:MAG: hypothetical protein EA397_01790 [Deltaproteobacteria bacterium]|nr:MAG: hypothetical protein EA397_01790 [Deltaproteobacteria bacterium]